MRRTGANPALRISHIVYGRTTEKGRVKYLVARDGSGEERAILEVVVLRRWRRRRRPAGFVFSGARLSSTVWRAIPALLGPDVSRWERYNLEELRRLRESKASMLRKLHLNVPRAETLRALFEVCGRRRLQALVERHASPDHQGRSGVPDLFLFARDARGRVCIPRFVEVKKPKEPVSQGQLDELEFMQGLGLHARVLRLIERK
jgi:VRR-NUC domain